MKRSLFVVLCLFVLCSCAKLHRVKDQMGDEWHKATGSGAVKEGKWAHVDAGTAMDDPFTGKCGIPTHTDDYSGFTIGQPKGWVIDYSSDTIVVAKDEKEMEGVVVFPARLKRDDIPAEKLATAFVENLGKSIAKRGGHTELTEQKTNGRIATATILATIDGVDLKGPLQVVEKPGFVTLKLYWAPKDEFDSESPTLKQVLTCYQRKTLITSKKPVTPPGGRVTKVGYAPTKSADPAAATASAQGLEPRKGRYINISMPAGWIVQDELENGIDVTTADKTAGVGFGWVLNPQRNQDPMTMVRQGVARYHPQAQLIRLEHIPGPQGWNVVEGEWEGGGMHGIDRAAMGRGLMTTHGWSCGTAKWESLSPTLAAIAATAQITPAAVSRVQGDVRAQLASYPKPVPSKAGSTTSSSSSSSGLMSGQDRSNQDFDDYIRGNERVTNSAGETIIAPTSMWNDSGPQGAGYYQATPGGGAELLKPIPPQSEAAPAD